MTDILVVEDNLEMGELLCDFLRNEGYTVSHCTDGEKAITEFEKGAKLVVLDVMLPKLDGMEVCRIIRETSNSPIIIVSARTEKDDKLKGILLGADDYIEKPYDIDILLAKIKGIFKRRYSSDCLIAGNIKLDKVKGIAYKDDEVLEMTKKEFELLDLFIENQGKILTKDMLFNKIWGFDSFSEMQTLTIHINWLRKKIEKDPKKPQKIQTIWGKGYRFESGD